MRTAYLDCIGGISGDMMLGALIDAGVDVERLVEGLGTLGLPETELRVTRVRKSGIAATHVEVVVTGEEAGDAPLLTMLNSCASGVAVVNIDNGFGAGYFAHLITRS